MQEGPKAIVLLTEHFASANIDHPNVLPDMKTPERDQQGQTVAHQRLSVQILDVGQKRVTDQGQGEKEARYRQRDLADLVVDLLAVGLREAHEQELTLVRTSVDVLETVGLVRGREAVRSAYRLVGQVAFEV